MFNSRRSNTEDNKLVITDFVWPDIPGIQKTVEDFRAEMAGEKEEHLIAINSAGKIEAENVGTCSSVEVPEAARGHFLVHTHPEVAAPLSIMDVCCVSSFDCLGNMAVCDDGTISWTSGLKDRTPHMINSMCEFMDDGSVRSFGIALALMGGKDVGSIAGSWYFLDFFLKNGTLKDLHVLSGDSEDAKNGRSLIHGFMGVAYPTNFSART
jgi:hypothetical protein